MSLEELCKDNSQNSVKSFHGIISPVMDLENIALDLMKDRLVELRKYIYINQCNKKILINLHNLKNAGYEINIS